MIAYVETKLCISNEDVAKKFENEDAKTFQSFLHIIGVDCRLWNTEQHHTPTITSILDPWYKKSYTFLKVIIIISVI